MSNIDIRALREAAEKALPAMKRLLMMPNDELFDEVILNVDGDVDAANAFNLLTGPETVLALLDELEAVQKTSAARLGAIDTTHKMFQRERDRAEAAEKRIAEMQALARGVKQFSEFQICHYGATEDYAKGYIDCQNNYNKVLFAAAGKGEAS
ncbi:ead/Ea22-like family protein [Enterobacter cloacae]|uniref:ead/Ea22-like family protein n=1 Tax=Enterobacter cloacae TaxID=550 RepID=UPI002005ED23|nr:ead/Ea22-like family protein [Enterobacter cloacae]MCK7317202.1 ead/Ea22-like family protein [Enterobacter cloacae]